MSFDKPEYRKTRRLSILEGTIYNGFFIVTQGYLLTGLALQYGSSELTIAIIGVLPILAQMMQIFAPLISRKFSTRKRAMLFNAGVGRMVFSAIPITLVLGFRNQSILLIILSIVALFNSLAGNFWVSLIKGVVPPEKTGKFFGIRNVIISTFSMVMTLVYSFILDHSSDQRTGFIIITIIAALHALGSEIVLSRHYDPPRKTMGRSRIFKEVLGNFKFRQFLIFSFMWNAGVTLASPFFSYHQIVNLGLDYSYLSYMTILISLTSMIFYPIWGKLSDEIGHQNVAEFGIIGASMIGFMWVFMNPSTYPVLMPIDGVLSGLVWAAINLSLFTTIMLLVPGDNVEPYFGVLSFVNGLAALCGSLIGGLLATYLKLIQFSVMGIELYGVQLLFLASGFIRVFSWLLLRKLKTVKRVSIPKYFLSTVVANGRRTASRPYEYASILLGSRKKKKNNKKTGENTPVKNEE